MAAAGAAVIMIVAGGLPGGGSGLLGSVPGVVVLVAKFGHPPVCGAPLAPGRQIAARGPAVAVTGRTTSGAGSALFSPNGLSGGQPPAGGQPPQAGPVEENQGWSIFSYLIAGMVA